MTLETIVGIAGIVMTIISILKDIKKATAPTKVELLFDVSNY